MDRAYPGVQRQLAISAVQSLGGRVVLNDLGVVIDLSSTSIGDDELRRLIPKLDHLPSIGELRLTGTKVTDRCVDHIQRLTSLKKIDLTGTSCTSAGATRLQRTLPDATVQR